MLGNICSIIAKSHLKEYVDFLQLDLQTVDTDFLEELHGVLDDIGRHLSYQDFVV